MLALQKRPLMHLPDAPAQPASAAASMDGLTQHARGRLVDDASKAVFNTKCDKPETDSPVAQVTTAAGKVLDGVYGPDKATPLAVDKFTWKPKGQDGYFVRMRHVVLPQGEPVAYSLAKVTRYDNKVSATPLTQRDADKSIRAALAHLERGVQGIKFATVQSFGDLPAEILHEAKSDGIDGGVKCVFHDGTVYLVLDAHKSAESVEKAVFHELYGHAGMQKLLRFGCPATQYPSWPSIFKSESFASAHPRIFSPRPLTCSGGTDASS